MALLDGKVVLVTGGGHGIGASIVRALARLGATVAINYNGSQERAEALAQEVGNAVTFQADVRDPEAVHAMVEAIVAKFGRIDGVVNNAIAGNQSAKFDDATWQDYTDMFDFGCKAVVNTVRAALPHFRNQGEGRVVNIVTELWNMGSAEWSTYLAGKGAMVGVSRSLANELGPDNVTVNMVAPGWMADDKVDAASDDSIGFGESLPLRRHGSAEEIGNACAFFLSDLSTYVTGAYIPVTGGRVTQMGG